MFTLSKYQGLETRKGDLSRLIAAGGYLSLSSLGLRCGTRPSVVVRYHPEGNFLAHLWTIVGARFGESVGDTGIFEILCVERTLVYQACF